MNGTPVIKHRAILITVLILLMAAGVGATVLKKRAGSGSQAALTAAALQAPATLEFLASDVSWVKPHDLRQTLPLSGSLRARQSSLGEGPRRRRSA